MRYFTGFLFLAILCAAGCVTKKEEAMRARQAYMAGQQPGPPPQAALPPGEPFVLLRGSVQHPALPWTHGMTLANAIVAADYTGFMNPILVRVIRQGQIVDECKGVDLLHGHDFPLESGDIILLQ
ncbi:MAG TPA: hypothetical protein VFC44_06540 [Candidatus Saccharimonadales bacterium]|nr:hypothetical protein [Candidatus Saccharimonadales bacterium]